MKARVIHTKFWRDTFVAELTPSEKLVFLYLISNESANILHCYECPDRTILFETGVNKDQLEVAKQKLEAAGKVRFFHGYVHLMNADRYQQFTGEKNDTARQTLLREMSPEVIDWYKAKSDTPIDTPLIPTRYHSDTQPIGSVYSNQYSVTNEGGVGETNSARSLAYLLNIPADDLAAFEHKYTLSTQAIQRKAEEMHSWCVSKGKTYRDYKSFLNGGLSRDQENLRTATLPTFIDVSHLMEEPT